MVQDVDMQEVVEQLLNDLRLLSSRVRVLEGRLQDRAITLGNKKGVTRRLRLNDADGLEVE